MTQRGEKSKTNRQRRSRQIRRQVDRKIGGRCAAANAHQQLWAIIITASSDNIIIAQSGGKSEAICRLALQLGRAGEIPCLCAPGCESLIILMRGWQRRDQRPWHASSHLRDKWRLALRPQDTWKLCLCASL